ncbi:hypothetical protein KSP39_PZI001903 [Platanthera zijinensis]|uniref:Uncharacterized protein n=1 Tax=Platanthera zijinensis TaxID=2320716 RepID=A0AAP0C137_9ASPA
MASGAEEDGVQHPESLESDRVNRCKEAARFLAKIRGAEREKRRRLVLRRRAQRLNGGKENKTFSPGGAPRNIDRGRRNPGSGSTGGRLSPSRSPISDGRTPRPDHCDGRFGDFDLPKNGGCWGSRDLENANGGDEDSARKTPIAGSSGNVIFFYFSLQAACARTYYPDSGGLGFSPSRLKQRRRRKKFHEQ